MMTAGGTAKEASIPAGAQLRAQRAADRAHNEAVLAGTDEQVVQAIAEEERQVELLQK